MYLRSSRSRAMVALLGATVVLTAVLASGIARAQSPPAAPAPDAAPMTVTTDTPDYCRRLHHQLEIARAPSDEVRMLTAEGWDMCNHGHVLGGLVRLRRAVTIMRDGEGER